MSGAGGGAEGCIVECMSPITAAKAVKNSDELKGMRRVLRRLGHLSVPMQRLQPMRLPCKAPPPNASAIGGTRI